MGWFGGGAPHRQSQGKAPWGRGCSLSGSVGETNCSQGIECHFQHIEKCLVRVVHLLPMRKLAGASQWIHMAAGI